MKRDLQLELEIDNLKKEVINLRWERDCLSITIKDKQQNISRLEKEESLLNSSIETFELSLASRRKTFDAEINAINSKKEEELNKKTQELELLINKESELIKQKTSLLNELKIENDKYKNIQEKLQLLSIENDKLEQLKLQVVQSTALNKDLLSQAEKKEQEVRVLQNKVDEERVALDKQKQEAIKKDEKLTLLEQNLMTKQKDIDALLESTKKENEKIITISATNEWILASNKVKEQELQNRADIIATREKQIIDKQNEVLAEKKILQEKELKFREDKSDFELNYRQAMIKQRESLVGNK